MSSLSEQVQVLEDQVVEQRHLIADLKADQERMRGGVMDVVRDFRTRGWIGVLADPLERLVLPPAPPSSGTGPATPEEKAVDLHATTDARVWAQEFLRINEPPLQDYAAESVMIGWFANAIETGRTAGSKGIQDIQRERDEARAEVTRLRQAIDEALVHFAIGHVHPPMLTGCRQCDAIDKLRGARG